MKLNDKTMEDLASQLGISANKGNVKETMKHYEKKSDQELLSEMMKIQKKMEGAGIPYEKQMAAVKSLMPMMNGQQKARLEKILGLLEK